MIKKIWKELFSVKPAPKKSGDKLTVAARLAAFNNLPKFLKLVWKTNPWLTISNFLIRMTLAVLPVSMLFVGKLIIDQVVFITHNSDKDVSHSHLWELVIIEFVLVSLLGALGRLISFIDTLLGDQFSNYCSMQIMSHAAKLDLDQFEDSAFYDKLERARQQSAGRAVLLSQILTQLQDIITLSFLVMGLIIFSPFFTFILFATSMPSFFSEYYFNNKNYTLTRSQMHRRRELEYLNYLGASDETAKEVRIFDLSGYLISRFRTISTKLYIDSKKLGTKRTFWGTFLAILASGGYYCLFIFMIRRVIRGELTLGDLTFLLGSIRQMGGVLQNVIRGFSTVSQAAIYLRDFFEFFQILPKIRAAENPRPFPNPILHGITFENVGFKYTNSNYWANRHLNFTLHAHEKLALVGENGAGKTTLVKLLVRLYDPTEGRILLDGHDLREYDLKELREKIGIIFQDFIRYQMTTTQNIAIGNIKEIDNHKLIVDSAKQSLANTIIDRLPNKYEQMLGRRFHNGIELSGGEWQKIALARAYMRDAQLMILDEPTAALDARAEFEVFERFSELTKNKMAVLVSHRFSTVRMADRIMVLEKGQILEIGSHEELLEKEGRYAELFQLQAMGYR